MSGGRGIALVLFILAALRARAIDPALAGTRPAPEFDPGLEWLNTDKPVKLADLRGKFVLLDFWTYCCINCVHAVPDLKRLEAKYPGEVVVVGVHSAKFANEKGTDNIRAAVLRYEVAHPVVNDKDFAIWNAYGVHGWPTFVLIDPDGNVVRKRSGEGIYDLWEPTIAKAVAAWDAEKRIDRRPLAWALERDKAPRSLLRFPGKLAADERGARLAIADSGHNRVVVVSLPDGAVRHVIGDGAAGLKDGPFATARFDHPQGLAFDGDTLYVADTENHAVRAIDLKAAAVTTVAGTGKQARKTNGAGVGTEVALNSPWDVLVRGDRLFVAMAGPHQIWTIDLVTREAKPFAGSSREHLFDGPLLDAALAQPSGLTSDGRRLYFADSETSSIRAADFAADAGRVTTLLGKGLFDFGDVDGALADARLQHPLAVCWHDGRIYVADAYNHKLKRLDLKAGTITTVAGGGKAGFKDGPAAEALLSEPAGLAVAGGKIYVADTNNHAVRVYDPKADRLDTLTIREPDKLIRTDPATFAGRVVKAPAVRVAPGPGTVEVTVTLPENFKLNPDAPFYVGASATDAAVIAISPDAAARNVPVPTFPLKLQVALAAGRATLRTDLVVYYCDKGKDAICLVDQLRIETPIEVTGTEPARTVKVEARVK